MKIVQYLRRFCPLSETFIYGLVTGLQRVESGTRVLSMERINSDIYPFDPVDMHPLVTSPRTRDLLRIAPSIQPLIHRLPVDRGGSVAVRLQGYFRQVQADVVHAHFGNSAVDIADSCAAVGIPLVVSLRGYDASRLVKKRSWRWRYRWAFRRAGAVIVVSKEMRDRISYLVPRRTPIYVIHAGKDPANYPARPPPGKITRVLSVGRLVEKKGHADAIRAIGYARSLGADVSLRIIGDGPLYGELAALIEREGLADHVSLSGPLPHDLVVNAMGEADAVVLACCTAPDGDMEGVPNVLKEAQLLGRPVIATRHAGTPEVMPVKNHGWLAAEGDWRHLGTLLRALVDVDRAVLAAQLERGRAHVVKEFSAAEEVARHLRLYEGLVRRRSRPKTVGK